MRPATFSRRYRKKTARKSNGLDQGFPDQKPKPQAIGRNDLSANELADKYKVIAEPQGVIGFTPSGF